MISFNIYWLAGMHTLLERIRQIDEKIDNSDIKIEGDKIIMTQKREGVE